MKIFNHKIILKTLITLFSIGIILYAYLVYDNNRDIKEPSIQEYEQSLQKAINWVEKNQNEIIKENNSILWWFLSQSAKLTKNKSLESVVNKYLDQNKDLGLWELYFNPYAYVRYDVNNLFNLPKYNLHFIYGLTCDKELAQMDVIKEQMDANFCRWSPIFSACTTHQLMGFHFMKLYQCGDNTSYRDTVDNLNNQVVRQLLLDPRVSDVYIQRVMMLMLSGGEHLVKPIWLHQIINAQKSDGAWETFYPLLPPNGESMRFGIAYKSLAIREYIPNFHTTSQAIYLLSLMLEKKSIRNK